MKILPTSQLVGFIPSNRKREVGGRAMRDRQQLKRGTKRTEDDIHEGSGETCRKISRAATLPDSGADYTLSFKSPCVCECVKSENNSL